MQQLRKRLSFINCSIRSCLLAVTSAVVLVSCGGGSSVASGTFTDAAPVSGLQYTTATQSGTTDSKGTFYYIPGETVSFSVGSITVGQATAASALNSFSLVGMTAPITSLGEDFNANMPELRLFQQAINISSFLQTLDSDADLSNGISIPSQAIALATNTNIKFNQKSERFQASFAFKNFIGRCRTAGIWGGTRVITSSADAANRLYAGLGLVPKLYAHSKNDNGASGYVTTSFDTNGKYSQTQSFNSSGILLSYSTFIYDANGFITQQQTFNGMNILQSSSTYTYDGNGLLTQGHYSDGGVHDSSYSVTYDANGNQTQSQDFDISGALKVTYKSTYDSDGNQTEFQTLDPSNVITSSSTYTYDADGNQTQELDFLGNGVLKGSTTFTYDANGNQTNSETFDGLGVSQSSTTNTYDSNGNTIKSQSFVSNLLQSSNEIKFDATGNLIQYHSFDGNAVLQFSLINTFDSNRVQTQSQTFDAHGVLQSSSTFTNSAISGFAAILRRYGLG